MKNKTNIWILDKKYIFFWTIVFAKIFWSQWLGEIISLLISEVLDHAEQTERLTHQLKKLVNQNIEIYDRRRIDEQTVTRLR